MGNPGAMQMFAEQRRTDHLGHDPGSGCDDDQHQGLSQKQPAGHPDAPRSSRRGLVALSRNVGGNHWPVPIR